MSKKSNIEIAASLKETKDIFLKKIESSMHFKSNINNDLTEFNWINEIEFACPYIDNIIRKPKLTLVSEEDIVKIEKARKITVASVKDLSIHTQFIEKIDKKTKDVQPSNILIERNEETFNIYENRFVYTLIDNMTRFMMQREASLEELESRSDKVLEYAGKTTTDKENINIELKITSKELPKDEGENDFTKQIETLKSKLKQIKSYMSSWKKSEFMKALDKAHASFVVSPIRKTNVILKNPNFQFAMKLWNFLRSYDVDEDSSKEGLNSAGDNVLKQILDSSFLIDYFVLDSVSKNKREQKQKLSKYAVLMLTEQVKRAVSVLLNCGIEISEEKLLDMISVEIKKEKSKIEIGKSDVKEKFEDVMDEYLDKIDDYM